MPYILDNTCSQDEAYNLYRETGDEEIAFRNALGCCIKRPDNLPELIRHKRVEIITGNGLDSAKDQPYHPLGKMNSVLDLKISKVSSDTRELNHDDQNPKAYHEYNQLPSLKIHNRPVGAFSPGYEDIQNKVKESSLRVNNVKAGKSVTSFLNEISPIESLRWAGSKAISDGNQYLSPKINNQPDLSDIFLEIDSQVSDGTIDSPIPPKMSCGKNTINRSLSDKSSSFILPCIPDQDKLNLKTMSTHSFLFPLPHKPSLYNDHQHMNVKRRNKYYLPKMKNMDNLSTMSRTQSNQTTKSDSFAINKLKDTVNSFKETRTKWTENLRDSLDRFEFYRSEVVRNKMNCLKINVGGDEKFTVGDKEINNMRTSAQTILINKRINNINKNNWFLKLIKFAEKRDIISEPNAKKLLLSIQHIVEDGYELTDELFYYLHVNILSYEDHKNLGIEALCEFVRRNIRIDPKDYYNFLKYNHFPIPSSLANDILTSENRGSISRR